MEERFFAKVLTECRVNRLCQRDPMKKLRKFWLWQKMPE